MGIDIDTRMDRYRIIEFAELDSTNRHACRHLDELTDGDVIQAVVQSAGHGRLRRGWLSHVPGNLCVSLVLKPCRAAPADLPLANLSQLLALSVCRVLGTHGQQATLKWPNDVRVGGRKIAGLLAETVTQGAGRFDGLVLGLGVNLNLDAQRLAAIDQPATSLSELTGRPVDVAAFRDAVLADFFSHYDAFLGGGFAMIRAEYLARCPFLGSHVEIRRGDATLRGMAHDVANDGCLEIITADGDIRRLDLGEMSDGA
jgi:BirA family biotin operon repressor/biotin-[acetyl-CoA-carboxylase] ligase